MTKVTIIGKSNDSVKLKPIEINLQDIRSTQYDRNVERLGEWADTCFICGKRTATNKAVHYTTDGMLSSAKTAEEIENSQGLFPIGNECAKKLPKQFIFQ